MNETFIKKPKVNLTPLLRFREFAGGWEVTRLDSITCVIDCKHRTPKYVDDGIPVVSPGTIKWGEIDLSTPTKRVTQQEYKSLMDHCIPQKGDLVFSRNQSIGVASIILKDEPFVLGQDTVLIQAKNADSKFFYYCLQTYSLQNKIIRFSGGSTFSRINLGDLRKLLFPIAKDPGEQQKIASFLSAVDEKIQQLTRKKELLEQYKKGVMQQIFSRKLRFKDENGNDYPEWEEKKLGDVGHTFTGLSGKTKENFGSGKRYIQYKQIFDNIKIDVNKCGLVQVNEGEKQQKVQYGDVFFTTSSETADEIGISSVLLESPDEMYLNSFCFGFRPNSLERLFPGFSSYFFRNEIFRRKIIKLAQGSTRYNMSKVELLKLRVQLPSFNEQQRIYKFLSRIDEKIETVGKQLEQSEKYKKGLLQQMFV